MSDKLYGLPYVYIRLYPSVIPLILANLFPFYGVLFLDWDLFTVMILFWLETAVLGFYGILRIIKVFNVFSVFIVPFFILHFGLFMLGHLTFLIALFSEERQISGGGLFSEISFVIAQAKLFWFVVLGFFISHGFSFASNFIGKKEYQIMKGNDLMFTPYKRVIVMHISLIAGAFLTLILNSPLVIVVLLLILKLYTDIRAHIKEHASAQKSQIN